MRVKLFIAFACFALAACAQLGMSPSGGATGSAQKQGAERAAEQDMKLMREIAQANIAEIETGKLALARAEAPAVQQFAQHMIRDHSALLDEGASLAIAKGMPVPRDPGAEHQTALQRLQALSGPQFDRAYMQQMVTDHARTVDLLRRAAAQAGDAGLRSHAQKAVPLVEQHLVLAKRLSGDLIGFAR